MPSDKAQEIAERWILPDDVFTGPRNRNLLAAEIRAAIAEARAEGFDAGFKRGLQERPPRLYEREKPDAR